MCWVFRWRNAFRNKSRNATREIYFCLANNIVCNLIHIVTNLLITKIPFGFHRNKLPKVMILYQTLCYYALHDFTHSVDVWWAIAGWFVFVAYNTSGVYTPCLKQRLYFLLTFYSLFSSVLCYLVELNIWYAGCLKICYNLWILYLIVRIFRLCEISCPTWNWLHTVILSSIDST